MNRKSDHVHWSIMLFDVAVINLALFLAYVLRYRLQWLKEVAFDAPLQSYLLFWAVFSVSVPMMLLADGAYNHWRGRDWLDHTYRVVNAVAKAAVMVMALTFFLQPLVYSRLLILEAGIMMVIFLSLARATAIAVQSYLRRRGVGVMRVVIVGAGEVGRRVMRNIVARPDLGYQIVGYVDDNPVKGEGEIGRFKGLGAVDNLAGVIDSETVDEVIITLPWTYHRRILTVLRECRRHEIEARIVPDFFQMSLSQVAVSDLGGVPLIGVQEIAFSQSALLFKRAMDVCGSVILLIVGAPIFAVIALAIKLDSSGPVFFRQERVGEKGRRFMIYKFRSMRQGAENELAQLKKLNEADGPLFKIRRDPRLTRVGNFLRRTSLDELPQLINVLQGDMSLVGPRPPIPAEVEKYQAWHRKRLEVPPGMTGLWQVSGRSDLTFDEMVLLDLYYVEHWSPWLDITIMLRTIPQVLLGDGAY